MLDPNTQDTDLYRRNTHASTASVSSCHRKRIKSKRRKIDLGGITKEITICRTCSYEDRAGLDEEAETCLVNERMA